MRTNKIVLYLSLMILAFWNISFQWPLKKTKLTSTFGESRADHFHDGIDLISQSDKIYPVETGKLVYYWDKTIYPLEMYPGGGNYKVLKHTNNILSIYMHLEDGGPVRRTYTTTDLVGTIGNTGHSFAAHLHLSFLNAKSKSSENPLRRLSPYKDNKKPLIKGMLLRIKDKYVRIRNKSKIRLTRHYPLLIEITDRAIAKERMGVYKLQVSHNNKKLLSITYDKLNYSPEGLNIEGNIFDKLFDEKGYYKINNITYTAGDNIIQVIATDFAGNQSEKTFSVAVKLDLK